jgi:hypothetical protein
MYNTRRTCHLTSVNQDTYGGLRTYEYEGTQLDNQAGLSNSRQEARIGIYRTVLLG